MVGRGDSPTSDQACQLLILALSICWIQSWIFNCFFCFGPASKPMGDVRIKCVPNFNLDECPSWSNLDQLQGTQPQLAYILH